MSRAALSAPGRSIRASDIDFLHARAPATAVTGDRLPSLAEAERTHIVRVLEATDWNKKEAARVLGISRGTLYRKILEYQLEPEPRSAGRRSRSRGLADLFAVSFLPFGSPSRSLVRELPIAARLLRRAVPPPAQAR